MNWFFTAALVVWYVLFSILHGPFAASAAALIFGGAGLVLGMAYSAILKCYQSARALRYLAAVKGTPVDAILWACRHVPLREAKALLNEQEREAASLKAEVCRLRAERMDSMTGYAPSPNCAGWWWICQPSYVCGYDNPKWIPVEVIKVRDGDFRYMLGGHTGPFEMRPDSGEMWFGPFFAPPLHNAEAERRARGGAE